MLLPPTSIEGVESGSGSLSVGSDGLISREVELRFLVMAMEGYTAAEAKGQELAPLFYDGHRRGDIRCTPVGGGWYQITVTYTNTGVDAYEIWGYTNPDGVRVVPAGLSVDTTGGSELVTQSIFTSGYQEGGPDAPDTNGAINVSGNQVNGVTKTFPAFNFSETWLIPAWYLLVGAEKKDVEGDEEQDPGPTVPYAQALRDLTGRTNKDKWRIFNKGEVLFLGARYEVSRGASMVPVTFSFSVQKTLPEGDDPFKVGDITVYYKGGWDFMWIYYEDEIDAAAFFATKKPKYVYIDQIYETANFNDLGIGDKWGQHFLYTGNTFAHPLNPAKRNIA
jgi:hypothetical protein